MRDLKGKEVKTIPCESVLVRTEKLTHSENQTREHLTMLGIKKENVEKILGECLSGIKKSKENQAIVEVFNDGIGNKLEIKVFKK